MRTLLTLALLCCATMAEAASWRPANQALIVTAPEGYECIPCEKLQEHIRAEYEGVRVGTERDAHFVVRPGVLSLGKFPQVWFYDAKGRVTDRIVGYRYTLYANRSLPERERLAALRKIVEKHPEFIPDKPPMAPPVEEAVAERSAPVRTANLVTIAGDGSVQIPESQGVSPNGRQSVQPVNYMTFAADCGGGGIGGGGGDFFTPPAQSYSMPYSDCSGAQSYAMPFSDCGGGGIGGGGGDYFTPPAQSYFTPQYAPQYGMSYAAAYMPRTYVVRSVPRATMPQFASRGISNFSLINIQPQLSLGGLFGGGLFGQRAYYAPRRSYRAAYSPFSYASYGQSFGAPMSCVNGVCYLQ